jgi:two-component system CheB/CheR fusion protein
MVPGLTAQLILAKIMSSEQIDPLDEPDRLDTLESFEVLDTPVEAEFDRLTKLATRLLHVPVSLVSLVTKDRQFFKSCTGLPEPWASRRETPLSHSFCKHVVRKAEPLIIADAREHPLVRDNLAVSELGVIAYLGVPLITEDGHVLGSFCAIDTKPREWTGEDIQTLTDLAASVMTELRLRRELRVQERLHETISEQRDSLQVMLTSVGDALIATDSHGHVTFMNPVAEILTGWSSGEAAGKPVEAIFRIVNEHTRKPVEQPIRKVLADGIVKGLANHTILIARDGTERPISDSAAPIKNASGGVIGVVLVFRDITKEREAQRAVGAAREFAENVVDTVREPLLVLDDGLRVRSANRTFYEAFRVSEHDTERRLVYELGNGQWNIPALKALLETVLPDQASFEDYEVEHDFPALGRRIMRLNARQVVDRSDHSTLILLAIEDITERKNIESRLAAQARALEENDRRRNEFLAMLAHELRNPLGAISNAARLSTLEGDHEELRFGQEVVMRQVAHLSRLIDDLLDVTRVSQGKIKLEKTTLELGEAVKEAVELVQPAVEQKKHELKVNVTEPGLLFEGDRTRVEQILGNLLTNAAKYTEPGGHIELSAGKDEGDVVFVVSDDGIGIAREMLPQVFGLFTQIDSTIDRSHGGLGIGLTLVRSLVELQGGEVSAASEGEGKGSRFTVRLPIGHPVAVAPKPERASAARAKKRILVVDDNQDTARLSSRLLTSSGHEVWTAFDGNRAVEMARSFSPDVILLDIGLPGLNGYEVTAILKEEECCADSMFIAISGYGEDTAVQRAAVVGFHHHLTKPLNFGMLVDLIESASSGG